MREIPLVNGRGVTLVDDEDYEMLSRWRWRKSANGYAVGRVPEIRKAPIHLHRLLLVVPKGMVVDHINHDGLDNRRANLRVATISQNAGNRRRVPPTGVSGYYGVRACSGRWAVVVAHQWFGVFDDPAEAAREYDRRATELFGEFARLNFPQQQSAAA